MILRKPILAALLLSALFMPAAGQAPGDPESGTLRDLPATARGSFEVNLNPQQPDAYADGHQLGRMVLDKKYHGDLDAKGKGQMLTAMSSVEGSAAYVAIEHVDGTLNGRRGSFVLHHRGVMSAGDQQLEIFVVPDSGTDELEGIEGTMTVSIEDGRHYYELAYGFR